MKKITLLLVFFAYFGSFAYANHNDSSAIASIISKCAEKNIDGRVYLTPGCVFVAQKNIIIKIDEDILPLEAVYCDHEGVYIYEYQLGSLTQCSTCKRYYDPEKQPSTCPHRYRWE